MLVHTPLMAQNKRDTGHLYIHLSPAFLAAHNFYLGLQPGLQYIYNNWAADAEFAFPLPNSSKNNLEKDRYRRFGFEVKKYRSKIFATAKRYHSLQLNYALRRIADNNGGYYYDGFSDSVFYYNKATIHSPVLAIALKTGRTYTFKKPFFLDVFGGIGLRRIFTSYSNVENVRKDRIGRKDLTLVPPPSHEFDQTLTRFHITAGFRLGVQIK